MHRTKISAAALAVALLLPAFQPAYALENPAKGKALAMCFAHSAWSALRPFCNKTLGSVGLM